MQALSDAVSKKCDYVGPTRTAASLRSGTADFGTPTFYSSLNLIADLARLGQFFFLRALKGGRVGEAPMETSRHARKIRAPLRVGFIANRNDVMKNPAGLDHIEHGLGLIAGNINADFAHCLDGDRVEPAGLKTGTVRLEFVAADLFQERLGHLAASAIVDADE